MGDGLKRAKAAAAKTRKPAPPARRKIDFDYPGRMLSGIKQAPEGHMCVWNSNLCVKSRGKVWFGDLDLTDDVADLKEFAAQLGEPLYVLREYDARFDNEKMPQFQHAVAIIQPTGEMVVNERT